MNPLTHFRNILRFVLPGLLCIGGLLLICYGPFASGRRTHAQEIKSAPYASPEADETNFELNRFFGTGPGQVSPDAYADALAAAQALPRSPLLQHRKFVPLTSTWTFPVPPPLANAYGGGASAMIMAIAVHPTNANIVYAGSYGGLAKSTDGGDHWTYISDGLSSQDIRSIAIDPNAPNIVYAGTGTANYYGVGIYRSTDSGATWKLLGNSQFAGKAVGKIAIDPAITTTLYASITKAADSSHAVWKSTDSGLNWVSIKSCFGCAPNIDYIYPIYDIAIEPVSGQPSRVYITAPDGAWKGDGSSGNWTYIHDIPDSHSSLVLIRNGLSWTLYLGYHTNQVVIEKSTNQGANWSSVSSLDGNLYFFAVDPFNTNHLFVGSGGDGHYSLNAGQDWPKMCLPGTTCVHPDVHSIAFCPSNSQRNYLGTDGGIYRADYNGIDPAIDWINKNQNLAGALIGGMSMSSDDHMVIGTQDNGTQLHTGNTPAPWTMICGGDGAGRPQIDQSNSNKYYYVGLRYNGHPRVDPGWPCDPLTRVINGSPTTLAPPLAEGECAPIFPALFLAPSNSARVLVGFQNVYRSINSGDSWTRIGGTACPSPVPSPAPTCPDACGIDSNDRSIILRLYEAPGNTNVIWAIAHGYDKLYVTSDANLGPAAHWADRTAGLPGQINAIVVPAGTDILSPGTAYAACTKNVYKTTDMGVSWTNLNLPDKVIYHDVAIDPANTQQVFVASHLGVFQSTNGGTTWANVSGGAGGIPVGMFVSSLSFNATSRHLAASTYGRGVYILDLSTP